MICTLLFKFLGNKDLFCLQICWQPIKGFKRQQIGKKIQSFDVNDLSSLIILNKNIEDIFLFTLFVISASQKLCTMSFITPLKNK